MVLSGTVLDLSLIGRWFESHWLHCIVSVSKTLYPLFCTSSTNMTENLLTGTLRKQYAYTVVPTKSDSDILLCLQLLSKILTCTLHLR